MKTCWYRPVCIALILYGSKAHAQVDHFTFSLIPSPQVTNVPFAVTIEAQDSSNRLVTNFMGPAALSGFLGSGVTSNSILPSPFHTSSSAGNWTLGYSFTPNTNMTVTAVRHYFGTKVSIWTDGGVLVAAQLVSSTPGTWLETALPAPVQLTGGTRYRIGVFSSGGNYYWRTDPQPTFPNGTIDQGYEVSGDNFPTSVDGISWLVDLRYTIGSSIPVPITPMNSGNFTSGIWSGTLRVSSSGTNVTLQADDLSGHVGRSNPFHVVRSNQPPIILSQPASQPVVTGRTVQLSVSAFATPPILYQWQFNGNALFNETNATLSLATVTTNYSGIYTVMITNAFGFVVSSNAVLTVVEPPLEFQIAALLTNNSRIVDHNALTGDDYGGIAVSTSRVLYSGETSSARFALSDLSGGTALGVIFNALVSDLRSGIIYSLAAGSIPLGPTGGTVTTLLEHDNVTGLLNGSSIALSSAISLPFTSQSQAGIFAGYGRILLHSGSRVYEIALPSGLVNDLGPMSTPFHRSVENLSAYWGVAEDHGSFHLVYVRDFQTIARTTVPDGPTTTLASFSSLSDMGAFTVSIPSNRWYFHYEGNGQFGGTLETLGYADAIFNAPGKVPNILTQPTNQIVVIGGNTAFRVVATGGLPLRYQWRTAGTNILGATNAVYNISNTQFDRAGIYSVVITNTFGSVASSSVTLTVLPASAVVGIFDDPAYVDTSSGGINAESDNVQATVQNLGLTPLPFTNFLEAVAIYPRIIIPEQENRFLNADLSLATRTALSNYVFNGGKLIVHGTSGAGASSLLNALFGLAVQETGSGSGVHVRSSEANSTEFADDPAGITNNAATTVLLPSTLPPHALRIYTNATGCGVVLMEHGTGLVVFLGWDWNDAQPRGSQNGGWLNVLESALNQGALPSRPPVITSHPTHQAAAVGTTVTFNARAIGTAPLTFQWRKDGENIGVATNASYSILDAQLAQSGVYSVLVTNLYGSATSLNAALLIQQPLTIISQPTNRTVFVGDSVAFSVVVSGSAPAYQWHRNGFPIAGATNSSYSVGSAQTASAGYYTVSIGNGLGTVLTSSAVLTVLQPPVEFFNSQLIRIPGSGTLGTAAPYPSTNRIVKFSGSVGRLELALSNLVHTFPANIDVLLVGPAGQKVILMSDAGGGADVTNLNLVFTDGASIPSSPLTNGVYRPTDFSPGDNLPAPAPISPYATNLAVFAGSNPNGDWRLYINDHSNLDTGFLGGWSLLIYPTTPPNDHFVNRTPLFGRALSITSHNAYASLEMGEPNHAGAPGGQSVWWTWICPSDGVVTINTAGSAFDTLLGVYTGNVVGALTLVASDDDGTNLQSRVSFQGVPGTPYQIAVDGFRGDSGIISLNITSPPPATPLIIQCPSDITVNLNFDTIPPVDPNSVSVFNSCGPVVRSLVSESNFTSGCQTLITRTYRVVDSCNQTNTCSQRITVLAPPQILDISVTETLQPDGVHVRFCAIVAGGTFPYEWSLDGTSEFLNSTCFEKVFSPTDEEAHFVNLIVNNSCGFTGSGDRPVSTCGICLSRGTPSLLSGTTGSGVGPILTIAPPTNNCGAVSANARWYKMVPQENGLVTLSTEGSSNNTLMVVYSGPLSSPETLLRAACNDDVSPSNRQSRVSFNAVQGTVYWIVVDPRTNNAPNLRLASGFEPRIETFGLRPDKSFELQSSLAPPMPYRIQASPVITTNAASWSTVLTTNLGTNYRYLYYRETNATNFSQRFYRIAPGP